MFAKLFKNLAPVHAAEVYNPKADGTYNLAEARRGRGKSYLLGQLAYHSIYRDNVPVRANFRIKPERMALIACMEGYCTNYEQAMDKALTMFMYCTRLDDFLTAYRAMVLWDEANRTLDAFATRSEIPPVLHEWAQQSRKHHLTLWFATQYMDYIDKRFRMLFDRLWRGKVVRSNQYTEVNGTMLRVPKRFNYYGSDPFAQGLDTTVIRRADWKFSLDFSAVRAGVFDSWEVIRPPEKVTSFRTFGEVEDHMVKHGLKPIKTDYKPSWDDIEVPPVELPEAPFICDVDDL